MKIKTGFLWPSSVPAPGCPAPCTHSDPAPPGHRGENAEGGTPLDVPAQPLVSLAATDDIASRIFPCAIADVMLKASQEIKIGHA